MKILIIGDIHGRLCWLDIIQKEQPDLTIFLGDYVSTHDNISSEQQLSNLEDILNYKEENPDKVVLLRGNHDIQHLGYYWAECSGWNGKVWHHMSQKDFIERFLSLTQWIYRIPDTNMVCSHAGISEVWLKAVKEHLISEGVIKSDDSETISVDALLDLINTIEPCELFAFTPCKMSDYYGDSATQPCTWIRPSALAYHGLKEIAHIVGHTPVAHINNLHNEAFIKHGFPEDGPDIWCCDCLANGEYLVIESGKLTPGKLNESGREP